MCLGSTTLTRRGLRGRMGRAKVYWDRYQAETDHKLFEVGMKLKKAKLVQEVIVDRHKTDLRDGLC